MTRWSRDCWSNVFTDLVTDKVKVSHSFLPTCP